MTQYTRDVLVSPQAGSALLSLARFAIERWLRSGSFEIDPVCPHPELQKQAGMFVTLRKEGELRGCIGQVTAEVPMYKLVQELAVSSACRDYRFQAIELAEWNDVRTEVSVLSSLHPTRNLNDLDLGRHGIVVKRGLRTGVYLPEVALETGWTKEEFLEHCAQDKAGLEPEQWKDAEIFLFTAQKIFG